MHTMMWRIQFSLRSIFVLTTLAALFCFIGSLLFQDKSDPPMSPVFSPSYITNIDMADLQPYLDISNDINTYDERRARVEALESYGFEGAASK